MPRQPVVERDDLGKAVVLDPESRNAGRKRRSPTKSAFTYRSGQKLGDGWWRFQNPKSDKKSPASPATYDFQISKGAVTARLAVIGPETYSSRVAADPKDLDGWTVAAIGPQRNSVTLRSVEERLREETLPTPQATTRSKGTSSTKRVKRIEAAPGTDLSRKASSKTSSEGGLGDRVELTGDQQQQLDAMLEAGRKAEGGDVQFTPVEGSGETPPAPSKGVLDRLFGWVRKRK